MAGVDAPRRRPALARIHASVLFSTPSPSKVRWRGCRKKYRRVYASQGRPTPRSVHASHRSPGVAGATAASGAFRLRADCADVWAKNSGVGVTDVSSLDSAVGVDEKGRRQTADSVGVAHLSVTVEQDSGGDVEFVYEGRRWLVAVALVDEQDNKTGMLRGGPFDQRHLAPARRAIGRPEVNENRTPSEVGKADACAVERVQSERWRRAAAR